MNSYCCWQEGPPVSFCMTTELKKPHTDHTPLFQHNIMKRMVSVVLYVHQLVQHSNFYNQVQGWLQRCSEPAFFFSF